MKLFCVGYYYSFLQTVFGMALGGLVLQQILFPRCAGVMAITLPRNPFTHILRKHGICSTSVRYYVPLDKAMELTESLVQDPSLNVDTSVHQISRSFPSEEFPSGFFRHVRKSRFHQLDYSYVVKVFLSKSKSKSGRGMMIECEGNCSRNSFDVHELKIFIFPRDDKDVESFYRICEDSLKAYPHIK